MMAKLMKDMDEAKAASKGISVESITPDGSYSFKESCKNNKLLT